MPKLAQPSVVEYAPALEIEAYGISLGKLVIAYPSDPILRDKAGYNLQVYRDLHREGPVKSALQQRRSAVVARERQVLPGDEKDARAVAAAKELEENLNTLDLDAIIKDMLFGTLMGFSVGQLVWDPEAKPGRWWWSKIRRHKQEYFRFDYDGNLYLITRANPNGEAWPTDKAWIFRCTDGHNDDPYGLGLGFHLYWPVFFRRNAHRFWQVYAEKFAMPTAVATAPPTVTDNPVERARVLQLLRSIRQDSGVIKPSNIEIDLLEATRAGQGDYRPLIEELSAEITTIVLSQQLTTGAEGGQYKADVQNEVKHDVIKEDADLLCASFNAGPARWWTDYNYGPEVPSPKLWIVTEPEEEINARAERDTKVYAMGYEPTQEYIDEWYGEGWKKRETPPPGPGGQPTPGLPSFAELGNLADALSGHDGDQISIKDAALQLALEHPEFREQAAQLLAYAESSGDFATFQKRLRELMEQQPPPEQVETLTRAGVIARLLGIRRQQR